MKGSSNARELPVCCRESSHDTFTALLRARAVLYLHQPQGGSDPVPCHGTAATNGVAPPLRVTPRVPVVAARVAWSTDGRAVEIRGTGEAKELLTSGPTVGPPRNWGVGSVGPSFLRAR